MEKRHKKNISSTGIKIKYLNKEIFRTNGVKEDYFNLILYGLILCIWCIYIIELPLQFTRPLSDTEVMEGQTATLECVVSKADQPAKWLRKGKALPKDNRITTSVDKNTHRLVLQSVTIDDEMEYSVKIGDKVSKATIFVEEEQVEFVRKLTDIEVHAIPSKAVFEWTI